MELSMVSVTFNKTYTSNLKTLLLLLVTQNSLLRDLIIDTLKVRVAENLAPSSNIIRRKAWTELLVMFITKR